VVPDLIMILDNEYRVVRVNKAMADRLGCTHKDLVGQICYDVFHGAKEPAALCPHARLMADGLSHTAEVHEDRLGGDFLVSVNPLHDPDGKLVGSVHVARDITERKQAEDALLESEERYRDLYENAPNAYFSISAVDGSVLRCNSAALQLLGYDKETITRMKVFDEILKRFQAAESIQDVELQMKRKDSQPIWISLTVEPLKDQGGNVVESRSMVINISERKRAEEALQKAHEELEQKVEDRTAELKREIKERKQVEESLRESENHLRHLSSQLLTAQENERKRIALELHDGIGQSLSALKFGVENSLKQMDKGTARPIIKPLEAVIPIIQESIEEVRKIAMDLRPATLDDLGILATIAWFCREFQTIYSEIRIEKQINIKENEVPELQKTVIYRVMQEAMNNIAKHSKADLVRLSLRKTDSVIELVIEDNGLGFDLEDALSVESSTRGLGLSSMKERTEFSGGSFTIEAVKGAGTIVRSIWRQ
jgi:PAS domain S-box-containing protein